MALMAARRTIAAVKTFLIYINAEQKGMLLFLLLLLCLLCHLFLQSSLDCLPILIVCGIIYLFKSVVMIIPPVQNQL